jgi:hypothetical protein
MAVAPCLGQSVPLSRSLAFMGRHRTITLTASDIESPDKNINSQPSKLLDIYIELAFPKNILQLKKSTNIPKQQVN